MSHKLLKPMLAAMGSGLMMLLMLTCKAALASDTHSISVQDHHGHSLLITKTANKSPMYILDGDVYSWHDLTAEQQQQILEIDEKIEDVEKRLEAHEHLLEPMIVRLETDSNELDKLSEAFEAKLNNLDDDEDDSITALPELEKRLVEHEKLVRKFEERMREKETKIRSMEIEFEKVTQNVETELNEHIDQIIKVLKPST